MTTATDTRTLADLLATPDLFRAWLEGDDLNRIVGRCQEPGQCPIAEFLIAQGTHYPEVVSTEVEYSLVPRGKRYLLPMPRWATYVVRKIDRSYGHGTVILACEVLAVLNQIEGKVAA